METLRYFYHPDLSIWLNVDPNGRMTTVASGDNDGDFYDRQGNYLGTDA
ncbi:MAG TPA: hypothetical protein GXZ40_03720 [Bacteroidales bacterium]|jgi:hypothetical protein|nr:hypothetical protein [Bacteroidales bacterium]